ncbi:aspartate/glutamate racemase family protein [Pararoseomonas indoligenes]|uniref:Hydantoin racemase n=1 Tax=Roseomonas indoligenes TaxID=2820811 RepID=A0A940N4F6_9PROT|nr:aspartate/glutamate racemase family protein [Pararoseomonas indoligenes]MBP0494990.1 hypothetical protein [Pararoseomonas indoligenes]
MTDAAPSKFRFLMVRHFTLPEHVHERFGMNDRAPKEAMLMNYQHLAPLLEDVDWDFHPGPMATHGDGDGYPETREELAIVGSNRLPVVREACESGRYNAIILLGGVDPGFWEAREIAQPYGVAVTANAFAQMHVACMLGARFSVLDISEGQSVKMVDLIRLYGFADRCASIRVVDYPLPRKPFDYGRSTLEERRGFARGKPSAMLEEAVREAIACIEEDGAESIILGCSGCYWLQDPLQKRLKEMGWDIPVLEGYRAAIEVAKLMVNLGVGASGIAFPPPLPRRWRRIKTF